MVVVVAWDFWAVAWALGAVRLGRKMNMVPATTAGALGQGPTEVATAKAMGFGLATTVEVTLFFVNSGRAMFAATWAGA